MGLLGTVVIATFALCFAPFLSLDGLATVLHRVFPFERGLFEDKVANFWCALSVVVKLKHHLAHTQLARLWCVQRPRRARDCTCRLTTKFAWVGSAALGPRQWPCCRRRGTWAGGRRCRGSSTRSSTFH